MHLRVSVFISNNISCNTCWNECMCCVVFYMHVYSASLLLQVFMLCYSLPQLLMHTMLYVTRSVKYVPLITSFHFLHITLAWKCCLFHTSHNFFTFRRTVAHTVSLRTSTSVTRVPARTAIWHLLWTSGTGVSFHSSASAFSCHYHFTNVPYLCCIVYCNYSLILVFYCVFQWNILMYPSEEWLRNTR